MEMNRRAFLELLPSTPLIANVPYPPTEATGPAHYGIPICPCGYYMLLLYERTKQETIAYCTNKHCPDYGRKYRVRGIPMEPI